MSCKNRCEFYDLSPIPIFGCVKRAALCSIFPPLWSLARADQLIACLSAQFPRYGARPEQASLSLPVCSICPVMACGPSGPAYHCLSAPHSARPERASLSLPCFSTKRAARVGQLIINGRMHNGGPWQPLVAAGQVGRRSKREMLFSSLWEGADSVLRLFFGMIFFQ